MQCMENEVYNILKINHFTRGLQKSPIYCIIIVLVYHQFHLLASHELLLYSNFFINSHIAAVVGI